MNSNLDLIVSATNLLHSLNQPPVFPTDHAVLSSLLDLTEVVAYSMEHCAGVERFFSEREIFKKTVEAATTVEHTVS